MSPTIKSITRKKKELEQISTQYKAALSSNVDDLKLDLDRWGSNFIVIAGSLYGAYQVFKLIKGLREKEPEEEEVSRAVATTKESSPIASLIKEKIALFILAIAMERLKRFLDEKQDEAVNS